MFSKRKLMLGAGVALVCLDAAGVRAQGLQDLSRLNCSNPEVQAAAAELAARINEKILNGIVRNPDPIDIEYIKRRKSPSDHTDIRIRYLIMSFVDGVYSKWRRTNLPNESPIQAYQWKSPQEVAECLPPIKPLLELLHKKIEVYEHEKQDAEHKQQEAQRQEESELRSRGYEPMTTETFILDGKTLAASNTKIALKGFYIRQGNIDYLYPDQRALMMPQRQFNTAGAVMLMFDKASRQTRQQVLHCQSDMAGSRFGCEMNILGRATLCQKWNASGTITESEVPCVAVE